MALELGIVDAVRRLEELFRELIVLIGEDPGRDGLVETPSRVARAWLNELTSGYRVNLQELVKSFDVGCDGCVEFEDMVLVKDIPVRSICEHHLLPFVGYAHIVYVPQGRVLGLSKLARVVDAFSRRLQIQERLTNQVADFIYENLRPRGVMVLINAYHTCTMVRGVTEPLHVATLAVRGVFTDGYRRVEALELLNYLRGNSPLEALNILNTT